MADWRDRLGDLEPTLLGGGLELRHARTFSERRRGLAGLDDLPLYLGLQIHRCGAVHTVGMRFALDLLWLDRDGRVLRVDNTVPPWRQRLCLRARSVVEIVAGGAGTWAVALGGDPPAP